MHFEHSQIKIDGFEIISLTYNDQLNNHKKEIWVIPGFGMNLCKYLYNEHTIIEFDAVELREVFYGTPLLYPTPNRVYEGKFNYNGKEYSQIKNGNLITIHGLLHNEPFEGVEISQTEESISVSAYVDFNETSHLYSAFPFEHRITVKYTLDKSGVRFGYEIENRQQQEFVPYGIALHPYFAKIDGEEGTLIRAPFEKTYETTETLHPTGKLSDLNESTDLRESRPVGKLRLDTVYTDNRNNEPAVVDYSKSGFQLILSCSSDFTHMVIYTPEGKPYFCLENQTCATNAHNLYSQGMKEVSGLKFVEPGSKSGGFIRFDIEKK
ncbi:MAG: aldose 1-epimerase [Eubacterium sp.]|nr:aldose 1-epimerase [Eubacterium sp.]